MHKKVQNLPWFIVYRVFLQLTDFGWVDFDPGSSSICPIGTNG